MYDVAIIGAEPAGATPEVLPTILHQKNIKTPFICYPPLRRLIITSGLSYMAFDNRAPV